MKIMAFNGSPRKKNWNTVTLLEHALFGVLAANLGLEAVFPVIGGFVVVMLVLISLLDRATQRP